VRCIDRPSTRRLLPALCATLAGTFGCTSRPPAPAPSPPPAAARSQAPSAPAAPVAAQAARARHWDEYRLLAARRLVEANPTMTYTGTPPEPLLAIPVLQVDLKADGSVAAVRVQRQPSQARETVQLAIDAVKRAAPFGPVEHLPRPWTFTEVFLFDDDRRFKPRTLD